MESADAGAEVSTSNAKSSILRGLQDFSSLRSPRPTDTRSSIGSCGSFADIVDTSTDRSRSPSRSCPPVPPPTVETTYEDILIPRSRRKAFRTRSPERGPPIGLRMVRRILGCQKGCNSWLLEKQDRCNRRIQRRKSMPEGGEQQEDHLNGHDVMGPLFTAEKSRESEKYEKYANCRGGTTTGGTSTTRQRTTSSRRGTKGSPTTRSVGLPFEYDERADL